MALLAGDEQRRNAILHRPIDLRAFVQQQPRCVDVTCRAGDEQRRHTALHRPVDLSAVVQKLRHRVDVASDHRSLQQKLRI